MAIKAVGFRLQSEGKAEVKNDFAEIRTAGQAAMTGVADSAIKAANDIADATDRATDRQIQRWKQAATAAKVAAAGVAVNRDVDGALGMIGSQKFDTVNLDRSSGAARASASVFEADMVARDQATAAALKLKSAIDPLWAAEQQLARALAEVATAERAGILSADDLAEAQRRAQRAFDDVKQSAADASLGFRMGDNADAQVRAYWQAAAAEQERAQGAAQRLKAAIDPLWAAEQRLEASLHEVALAEKAGVLTSDDLAQARGRARKEFDLESDAIKRRNGAGGGLSTNQRQTLIYTASDVVGSLGSGASPGTIALQQGPQVLQAFAAEEGGMAKIVSLLNPMTIGLTAIAGAAVIGTAAWADYSAQLAKLNALAVGSGQVIGITGDQMEANAEAAARAGDISVAAAREIEAGYVQMGGVGAEVLVGLTAITTDFAKATGQDTPAALQQLGAAFRDPAAGADDLTAKYGILDQKTLDYIHTLVEQNDLYGAQKVLLNALNGAFDGAAEHANVLERAWKGISNAASSAWTNMGKAIDRMLGGGTAMEQIGALQRQRDLFLRDSLGKGDTSFYDKQIADLQTKLKATNNAGARSRAVAVMRDVDGITGEDDAGALRQRLSAVNGLLRDNGRAAGLNADQLARAREAQDALTHAVDTYMPAGQRSVRLAQIDAEMASTKDKGRKAELASEKTRLSQSGQVITAAQAEALATANGIRARNQGAASSDRHAQSLARQAEAMRVSAAAALDVADAYLKSSAAGMTAEARRKALTDATRRGIGVDEQVARQLAVQVGEGAAAGARTVAQLRDETVARAAANDNVIAGKMVAAQMNDVLRDEAALRPLIALQSVAQGDALLRLTSIIAEYRKAQAAANVESERSSMLQANRQVDESIIGLQDQIEFAGDRSGRGTIEIARRAAEREAADRYANLSEDDRQTFVANRVSEAGNKLAADRAQYMAGMLNDQADSAVLMQRDLDLVGMSAEKRAGILDLLKAELDLRARGIDMTSDQAIAVLAGVEAETRMASALKLASATMDELRGFGESFVDTVLSEDTWSSWGNAGKAILGELKAEFVKLALLNPIKNLLSGDSALPTLGGAIGKLTSLFGTAASPLSLAGNVTDGVSSSILAANSIAPIGRNAAGTEHWSGGLTYVNENGDEIMDLPTGTRIYPAAKSREMMAAGVNAQAPVSNHFHLTNPVMTQDLLDQMNAIGQGAAIQGAAGGAQISSAETTARAHRALGRGWGGR